MKGRGFFCLISVLLVVIIFSLIACGPQKGVSGKGKVIFGAFEYPPYAGKDAKGKVSGYYVEICELAAKKAGLDYELRYVMGAKELLELVAKGEITLAGPLFKTQDREAQFDYSQPMGQMVNVLFVSAKAPKISEAAIKKDKIKALERKAIAVGWGEVYGADFDKNEKIKKIHCVNVAEELETLKEGKADGAITDRVVGHYVMKERKLEHYIKAVGIPLTTEKTYFLTAKGKNAEVLSKLNKALGELEKEGKIAQLEKKYISM